MEIEPVTVCPTSPKRAARVLQGRWTLLLCCSAPAERSLSSDQSLSSQRPWLCADLFANHRGRGLVEHWIDFPSTWTASARTLGVGLGIRNWSFPCRTAITLHSAAACALFVDTRSRGLYKACATTPSRLCARISLATAEKLQGR